MLNASAYRQRRSPAHGILLGILLGLPLSRHNSPSLAEFIPFFCVRRAFSAGSTGTRVASVAAAQPWDSAVSPRPHV
jgi:hypothetical protein